MTIREFYDRFVRCTREAKGEPCPTCDRARAVLDALAAHTPEWSDYMDKVSSDDQTAGQVEFQQLQTASDALVRCAIFCWMMATAIKEENTNEPIFPQPKLWMEHLAASLHREMRRSGLRGQVAVYPYLDIVLVEPPPFDPKATKH